MHLILNHFLIKAELYDSRHCLFDLELQPAGEQKATDVLNDAIDTFYQRKSKHLRCDVFLLTRFNIQSQELVD